LRTFPVPMCHTQHDNEQQYAVEQQGKRHFRNGNIPRANLFACGVILYQFAFLFASCGSDGKSFIRTSILFETGRKERVPT
jgi:anaerobic glycerol-3-phosphate dehydrogenase